MDGVVTIETRTPVETVAWRASRYSAIGVIHGSWMAGPVVTVLAEIWNFFFEQVLMSTAVSRMADGAVLFYWQVFFDERTSFFRMTLVAELVGVFGPDHVVGQRAVGVMAIAAQYLSFNDRVVGTLVGVASDVSMTPEANGWLVNGASAFVNIVAGNTGNIIFFVHPHIPEG